MIPGMTDMMMGRRAMLGMGMGVLGLAAVARQGRGDGTAAWRWGVDYGASTDPELARGFDLLVLEPHHARPIAPLRREGSTLRWSPGRSRSWRRGWPPTGCSRAIWPGCRAS